MADTARHPFDDPRTLRRLEQLAARVVADGREEVSEAEVLEVFAALDGRHSPAASERTSQASELLSIIQSNTGVLVETGRVAGEGRIAFIHRSFAEYLSARHHATLWRRGELDLARLLRDDAQSEVALLMFAHIGSTSPTEVSRLIRQALEIASPAERTTERITRFALSLLADGVEVEEALRDELVSSIDRRMPSRAAR